MTSGVYRVIRHPQYAALAVAGAGLLLLWPRFLVLVLWVTMLFAYAWLARLEERECERRFGDEFRRYLAETGAFVPRSLRRLRGAALYGLALLAALGAGTLLRSNSVRSLQAAYSERAAFVAVVETEPEAFERVVRIARGDAAIRARLDAVPASYINYVLPAAWYVPEIPMNRPREVTCHHTPAMYDPTEYRVVFTRAELGQERGAMGRELLTSARERTPLFEAIIDLSRQQVIAIAEPAGSAYAGVPVPVL